MQVITHMHFTHVSNAALRVSNSLKCLSLHEHVFVTTRVHLLHCHVNMLAVCIPGMNSFSPGDKRVVALRVTGVSNKGVW